MSDNLLNEFKELEQQVEKNKTEKIRLEERIKNLREEREKSLKELYDLGVKEEELESTILKLESEIKEELTKCKTLLQS